MDFKFNLGDKVRDKITGYEGIVYHRSQWLHNCNTYGVKQTKLDKDGKPIDSVAFDEPALELIEEKQHTAKRDTGGPEKTVRQTNR